MLPLATAAFSSGASCSLKIASALAASPCEHW